VVSSRVIAMMFGASGAGSGRSAELLPRPQPATTAAAAVSAGTSVLWSVEIGAGVRRL
jgi:hypothetical protein